MATEKEQTLERLTHYPQDGRLVNTQGEPGVPRHPRDGIRQTAERRYNPGARGPNVTPANLTPEYRAAEAAFRKARDPAERLERLREMLRVMPKHKGTNHLQGDIKRRIKELSEELSSDPGKVAAPAVLCSSSGPKAQPRSP